MTSKQRTDSSICSGSKTNISLSISTTTTVVLLRPQRSCYYDHNSRGTTTTTVVEKTRADSFESTLVIQSYSQINLPNPQEPDQLKNDLLSCFYHRLVINRTTLARQLEEEAGSCKKKLGFN